MHPAVKPDVSLIRALQLLTNVQVCFWMLMVPLMLFLKTNRKNRKKLTKNESKHQKEEGFPDQDREQHIKYK